MIQNLPMADKKTRIEVLNGNDNYEIWRSRIEVLAKRKDLGALMHFQDDYANALQDGKVDRFLGNDEEAEQAEERTGLCGVQEG